MASLTRKLFNLAYRGTTNPPQLSLCNRRTDTIDLRFVVPDALDMPARPKVGAQIRRARQLLDMRQQDLADKIGVSRNTVDSWENNRAYPQRKMARLEQVLGVSLSEPEAEPELVAMNDWEEWVLSHKDLPDHIKRTLILDWRASRSAGTGPSRSPGTGRTADPGRAAG